MRCTLGPGFGYDRYAHDYVGSCRAVCMYIYGETETEREREREREGEFYRDLWGLRVGTYWRIKWEGPPHGK